MPEPDTPLRVEQQCLLGIALMTQRVPNIVRTPAFAAIVEHWRKREARVGRGDGSLRVPSSHRIGHSEGPAASSAANSDEQGLSFKRSSTRTNAPTPPRVDDDTLVESHRAATKGDGSAEPLNDRAAPGERTRIETRPSAQRMVSESELLAALHGGDGSGTSRIRYDPEVIPFDGPGPRRQIQRALETSSVASDQDAPTLAPHAFPAAIETQVGGVLYLLNVALSLELYADFTKPLQPGLALSIWDFLSLVGQRLTPPRFRHDALWGLLANLAGRAPEQPPGAGFDPPYAWRVPAAWLSAFPRSAKSRWSESTHRLRVVHPAGFAIVDVPCTSMLLATTTTRWIRWLVPYLRARIGLALGEADCRRAGAILCAQSARIFTSPTHVDVMFSLAELPIAVRRSGLDRNPGWVPSAGRVMTFHYE
jgi:hypothetical protein